MKGDVETYHQDGEWKNKIEGEAEPLGTAYATKADAAAGAGSWPSNARSSTSSGT